MTKLARARNRSALKWSLATISVWIGTELIVGFVLEALIILSSMILSYPKYPQTVIVFAYVLALLAALISAELMIRRLRSLPALPVDE